MNQDNKAMGKGSWIQQLWQTLQPKKGDHDPIVAATDRVVQIADPVIRQAKRYRQVL